MTIFGLSLGLRLTTCAPSPDAAAAGYLPLSGQIDGSSRRQLRGRTADGASVTLQGKVS